VTLGYDAEEEIVDALGQQYVAPRSFLVEYICNYLVLFRERGILV